MSRKDPSEWAAYMREYRRRPGKMDKHNEQTREWKRLARTDYAYLLKELDYYVSTGRTQAELPKKKAAGNG